MADITPHPAGTSFFTVLRAFLRDHERLLLGVIAGLVIWVAVGKVQDIIARHDDVNLQQATVAANAQAIVNKTQAELVAQQKADFAALAAKSQTQEAALENANIALANALTARQKVDATLTDPELAARWNVLVPAASVVITNGQATLADSGAHATVNELEKVPVLTEQVANGQNELKIADTLLDSQTTRVVTLEQSVDGLNLQIADDKKVCQDQVKVVKDAARKSKRRWFIIGFVAGFASRQAIKTYLGF